MNGPEDFSNAFSRCPLVAILRGIEPAEAAPIGDALVEAGFTLIEVPLNSPEPFESMEILARRIGAGVLVGAGTVLRPAQVRLVQEAGGRMVVSPNVDRAVIEATAAAGLASLPGYATVSEAFTAIDAGRARAQTLSRGGHDARGAQGAARGAAGLHPHRHRGRDQRGEFRTLD